MHVIIEMFFLVNPNFASNSEEKGYDKIRPEKEEPSNDQVTKNYCWTSLFSLSDKCSPFVLLLEKHLSADDLVLVSFVGSF